MIVVNVSLGKPPAPKSPPRIAPQRLFIDGAFIDAVEGATFERSPTVPGRVCRRAAGPRCCAA
jgi:hypothetical protein